MKFLKIFKNSFDFLLQNGFKQLFPHLNFFKHKDKKIILFSETNYFWIIVQNEEHFNLTCKN